MEIGTCKRIITLLLLVVLLFSAVACSSAPSVIGDSPFKPQTDDPKTLRFNRDGKFKIMFISDLHSDIDNVVWMMDAMLECELPDFVIFGGDTCVDVTADEIPSNLDALLAPVIERGIPWCHVYGNHDRECGLTGDELQQLYYTYDYCLSSDVEELDGTGTYYLPVLSSDSDDISYIIWCMDSHDYIDGDYDYDCVHADQVEWYKNTSAKIEADNGKKINGLMFMHIPMREFITIRDNPVECEQNGFITDGPCCSSHNFGLFDAIKERGDVTMVVNGHDHVNNASGKLDGITLAYAGSLTRNSYINEQLRGVRVAVIDENDTANPETYFLSAHDILYKFYRIKGVYDETDD